jgi:hypothetical protein
MLSEIETNYSATALVANNDAVDEKRTVLVDRTDASRLSGKQSHSSSYSFFYIAMGISRPRARSRRRDRRPIIA